MPQRNEEDKQVGIVGGDSASTNTPFENSLLGVPDIRFSDTSLPVFANQFQVIGTWNMPVTGLIPQTGGPVSAGVGSTTVAWVDQNFEPTAHQGSVEITHFDGGSSMFFAIEFPNNRHGILVVSVNQNSATSAVDNRAKGPRTTRLFRVEYDTRLDITPDTINDEIPALLHLSAPYSKGIGTWKNTTYLQGFYFTKPVGGFTEEDITIEVAGSGTATLSNFQKTQEDNQLYTALITFTGSGTYTVKVDANSAKSAGASDDNTPPSDTQESWAFDVTQNITDFTIDGVEVLHKDTRLLDIEQGAGFEGVRKGSYLGVSDLKVHDGRVYFTSQIQRRRTSSNRLSTTKASAGALVSVDIATKSLQVHKNYSFFRQAARSFVVHNNRLHFFEGSAYLYPDARLISTGAKIPVDKAGFVYKIVDGQEIEQVGLNWRSDFPTGVIDKYDGAHGGTFSPMISVDDSLHLQSAKADILDINGYMWIVYSKKLNQRISLLETNGKTGFDIVEQLAGLSNSIIGFTGNRFEFVPRKPIQAYVNLGMRDDDEAVSLKDLNRIIGLSNTGIVLIDKEVISYGGILATSSTIEDLVELKRGLAETDAANHSASTPVVFIDKIINSIDLARPINDMDISQDGTTIYNNILTQYAQDQVPRTDYLGFPTVDRDSKNQYGDRKFKLELPLDFHQRQWAILISKEFVRTHKDLRTVINLTLKRDFDIKLGDVVYLTEPVISDTALLCQVMSISPKTSTEETEIIVVSISPDFSDS